MNEVLEENVFDNKPNWHRLSAEHFRESCPISYADSECHFSELHLACRAGSIERVVQAVRHGADIESRAEREGSPLHIACGQGNRDIVRFLLRIGADVNARDSYYQTPIFKVAGPYTKELIADLCEKGADVCVRDRFHRTALDVACVERNFQKVQALAGKGLDTVQLHLKIACAFGDFDTVQCLIENGADVNRFSEEWLSPLHCAAYNNHVHVGQLLIKHGCELSRPGVVSPLHLAVSQGHVPMVEFLLCAGIDPNDRDERGATALHYACSFLQPGVVSSLLKHGANPNAKDDDRFSPLIYLLRNECPSVDENTFYWHETCDARLIQLLSILLENGLRLEPDIYTYTTEFLHAENNSSYSHSALNYLSSSDSDSDNDAWNYDLYVATDNGHIGAVQCFLKAGMKFEQNEWFMDDDWLGEDIDYDPLALLLVSRWCKWRYLAGIEVPLTKILENIVHHGAEFLEHPTDAAAHSGTVDHATNAAILKDVRQAKSDAEWLLEASSSPRSLFFLCCIRVRHHLAVINGSNIFPSVNLLQVPHTVRDALKLSQLPPRLNHPHTVRRRSISTERATS